MQCLQRTALCSTSSARWPQGVLARPQTRRQASMHGSAGGSGQRTGVSPPAAYAPSLPSPAPAAVGSPGAPVQQPRQSLDPMAAAWEQQWEAGRLVTVKSPQAWEELLAAHADKLVVLMCKSHSCRPCKMFTRKYISMAARFPECVLGEIYGDETPDTRKMMMALDVRVTPTFRMYRAGECVGVVTGTNETKLMRGILAQLSPAELVGHAQEISDTLSYDEGDEQQQQQQPAAQPPVPAPSSASS